MKITNLEQNELLKNLWEIVYPVGSYYETSDPDFDPNVEFGGYWVKDGKGRTLINNDERNFMLTYNDKNIYGGKEAHKHLLPYALDNASGNWSIMHWNNSFGYGTKQITTPNINHLQYSPEGVSQTMYQYYSENVSNMPPFIQIYRWHRVEQGFMVEFIYEESENMYNGEEKFFSTEDELTNFLWNNGKTYDKIAVYSAGMTMESVRDLFGMCPKARYIDVSGLSVTENISVLQTFNGCTSLKTIDMSNWNSTNIGSAAFVNVPNGCKVYVLNNSVKQVIQSIRSDFDIIVVGE